MGKLTFLGTGTSHGIPMIGCDCAVCTSSNPRNQRFRSSVLVETDSFRIVIDTPPEFRLQALRAGIRSLDAVLITHSHADHIFGFDDLRLLSRTAPGGLPCYASSSTASDLRRVFRYVFEGASPGATVPNVRIVDIDGPIIVRGKRIIPIPIMHGTEEILGFRIGKLAYITDCSRIPQSSYSLLEGLDVLVLNALRFRPHVNHFTIDQALREVERIRPRVAYLTHIAHDLDHDTVSASLPGNVHLAHDCLQVAFAEEDSL